jgi:hypothetical protein
VVHRQPSERVGDLPDYRERVRTRFFESTFHARSQVAGRVDAPTRADDSLRTPLTEGTYR